MGERKHTPANSMSELQAMTASHTMVSGFGLETKMTTPCPFCGAPGHLTFRVAYMEEDACKPTRCGTCERTSEIEIKRSPKGASMRIYLAGGPDVPEWFTPKPPRRTPTPT